MVLFEHPASIPTEQYDGVVAPMWQRATLIVQAAVSLQFFSSLRTTTDVRKINIKLR